MKILLIEDERKVASFIKKGLLSEGYAVDTAFDGEEGLFMAQEGNYDAIILDIKLPKLDGITVCRKIRSLGRKDPVIMLTAKDSVDDKITGLDAGADDYLTKPFSFSELLARIRALIRRQKPDESSSLSAGGLEIDPERYEVKRDGRKIDLSATEFKLLKYLVQNKNRVVSKTLILENVWGYDFSPESNIVDVYIKYLRDKIDRGFDKNLLQTVRGIGYKLCE